MKRFWRERLRTPPRGLSAAALVVAFALTITLFAAYPPEGRVATINALWPPLWVVAGLLIWHRRPGHVAGPALVVFGVWLTLVTVLRGIEHPIPYTFVSLFAEWNTPLLIWAVLAFPSGAMTRVAWALVLTRAVNAVVIAPLDVPWVEPRRWTCFECPEGMNLLLIRDDPDLVIPLDDIGLGLLVVEALVLIAVLGWRIWSATPPARRVLTPVYLPMMAFMGGVAAKMVNVLRMDIAGVKSWTPGLLDTTATITALTQLWLPLGVLLGFALEARRRDRVGRVLDPEPGSSLEDGIRRTLGDSAAQLVVGGAPPEPVPGLRATPLEHGGRRVGTLLHDPASGDDARLLRGVVSTAALAVANGALADELAGAVADVQASQGRLVFAGEEARRRVERELSHGAVARLRGAIAATRGASAAASDGFAPALRALQERLEDTLDDVQSIARGLTPPVLAERGLAGALEELTAASPFPARIDAVPAARAADTAEETAFFIVSEALANAAKHAHATEAVVRVELDGERLRVEVRDDGRGGADPAGSGLRGLAERVEQAGGTLLVDSPPGAGTRVTAEIPARIAAGEHAASS